MKKFFAKTELGDYGSWASILGLLIAVYALKDERGNVAFIIATLAFVVLSGLSVFAYKVYRKEKNAELDAYKAALFDYKFCAPIDSPRVRKLLGRYGVNFGKIKELQGEYSQFFPANCGGYLKAERFFSSPSYSDDFVCKFVRNGDKSRKVILQFSFIPMDRDGYIPLILRLKHFSSAQLNRNLKFGFVSFSPIPFKFGDEFSVEKCYYREVPPNVKPANFEELGFMIRRVKDGRIYLFFLFVVHYDCRFRKPGTREIDWETVNKVFLTSKEEEGKPKEYFYKDHDPIITVQTPRAIYRHFFEGENEEGGSSGDEWISDPEPRSYDIAETPLLGVKKEGIKALAFR